MKRSGKETWKMSRSVLAEEVREEGRPESMLIAMAGSDPCPLQAGHGRLHSTNGNLDLILRIRISPS